MALWGIARPAEEQFPAESEPHFVRHFVAQAPANWPNRNTRFSCWEHPLTLATRDEKVKAWQGVPILEYRSL